MNLFSLSKYFLIKSAGKVEDLKFKYPDHIEIIDLFNNEDPSKSKKYLEWMVKQSIQGFSKNDIIPTIKYFDKYNSRFEKKDINQYNELKELENLIKDIEFAKQEVKEEKAGANAPGNIYNSDRFSVIRPDDKGSCIVYGKGTKWCITMKNESFFEEYASSNTIFYFIIDKDAKPKALMGKIAFAYIRDKDNKVLGLEVYDAEDGKIGLEVYDDKLKSKKGYQNLFMDPSISNTLGDEYNKIMSAINGNLGYVPKTELAGIEDETDFNKLIIFYNKYKGDFERLKLLIKNQNLPQEMQSILVNDHEHVRIEFAKNKSINLDFQIILAKDKSNNVRGTLAQNPSLHLEAQKILANDNSPYIRGELAKNPSLYPEIQNLLVDDDIFVRTELASNPSINLEIQKKLANNEDNTIKMELAGNLSIDLEIQKTLVYDENDVVKTSLARNRSIYPEIQKVLANDENWHVRLSLASNPSISLEVQNILANDENKHVINALFDNSSIDLEIKKYLQTKGF